MHDKHSCMGGLSGAFSKFFSRNTEFCSTQGENYAEAQNKGRKEMVLNK